MTRVNHIGAGLSKPLPLCDAGGVAKLRTDLQVTGPTRAVRIGTSRWGVHVPFRGAIDLDPRDALGDIYATVEMTLDLVEGVLQPVTLCVTARAGTPVNGTALRQLPVRGMANALIHLHVGELDEAGTFTYTGGITGPDENDQERIRLQGPTTDSLKVVADFYELGRATGRNPARFVESTLGMPRTTVSKWVRRARDLGMISEGVDRGVDQEA